MTRTQPVTLRVAGVEADADLTLPEQPAAVVAFAHGSGSSRKSPRNRQVAATLAEAGFATLLLDLLTADEDEVDRRTRELRFDVDLLGRRVVDAVDWLTGDERTRGLPAGLFGASTGAAAALTAAAARPEAVGAVVSRGGRPDLAGDALPQVRAPTLLIVGGADEVVLGLNEEAASRMEAERRVEVVPGASHLFEEPGALERVARLARDWFARHLLGREPAPAS